MFTLKSLASCTTPVQLRDSFTEYLDGFSANVQEIIKCFEFRNHVQKLTQKNILSSLIQNFLSPDIDFPGMDNHTMGMVFEEIIRRFNEETNITDAGRHFTPRDIVSLAADLAFLPVRNRLNPTTYRIYDGACGTGGMLTIAEDRQQQIAREEGLSVSIWLYGQELSEEIYAIAKSDMLLKEKGEYAQRYSDRIFLGATISQDKIPGETFDFMISNPPFGTPWKTDLTPANGWADKKDEITDERFNVMHGGKSLSLVPDLSDAQMLFLANNISRMKSGTSPNGTPLSSRIVEIHNGSSLFTGKAGQGASNLRQYIIENDLLEAVIALPERMFYNTGIKTYIWVLSNLKEDRRKGKIQLIDASQFVSPMRKNLGEKSAEITPEIREHIMRLYDEFDRADRNYSAVAECREFGFWEIGICTHEGNEREIVPFTYPGGIEGFLEHEVRPYSPEAYISGKEKTGYEIQFSKYFFRADNIRTRGKIAEDIMKADDDYRALLREVLK